MLNNPFRFGPAEGDYFVARDDLQADWRTRLAAGSPAWNAGKSWLILGEGGMGKSSVLRRLKTIAAEPAFNAHVILQDFGLYRETDDLPGLLSVLETGIANRPDPGTRLRTAAGLPPTASPAETAYQFLAKLWNHLGPSLSQAASSMDPASWSAGVSFAPTLPELSPEKSESILLRTANLFLALREVAGRSDRPFIVLLDQLGKAYDDRRWVTIAAVLLSGIRQFRQDGIRQVVFVLALRSERFGLLNTRIANPDLFHPDLFQYQYLQPLTAAEARQAIGQRARAYFSPAVETGILQAISQEGSVSPFRLIEACSALWPHVYPKRPDHLSLDEIRAILTGYYRRAIQEIMEGDIVQWQVLDWLTNYPGGRSLPEITKKLSKTSPAEAQKAIDGLLNHPKYVFIQRVEQPGGPPIYRIAHELLIEALNSEFPADERQLRRVRNIVDIILLSRSTFRQPRVLSSMELDTLLEFRDVLKFNKTVWEAITFTLINDWRRERIGWLIHCPGKIADAAVSILEFVQRRPKVLLRAFLIPACLHPASEERRLAVKNGLDVLARNSVEWRVTISAGQGLARLGETESARDILVELTRSDDEHVCREAAEELARLGESARDILVELTRSDDSYIRREAAKGLARLGESARDILIELARSDDSVVRREAAEGIAGLGENARDILIELARSDDSVVRLAAAKGLAGLGESARDILIELARSDDSVVRREAAKGLAGLGESARDILIELARSDDSVVRREAAKGLVGLGETELVRDALVELVRSDDWFKRWEAAKGLARLGESARDILIELARSDDSVVRREAAEGIAGLGENAQDILVELARSDKEYVRREAAKELARLGESARDVLVELARSNDSVVRLAAAKGLAGLGETELVRDVLVELARSDDSSMRREAAKELAGLGETELVREALVELVRSDDWFMRWEAAKGLVGLGETELVRDVLDELVRSDDWSMRWDVPEGLAGLGESARSILFELAHSDDWRVRLEAVQGLAGLGESARDNLVELAHSDDWQVRLAAAKELAGLRNVGAWLAIALEDPLDEPALDLFMWLAQHL